MSYTDCSHIMQFVCLCMSILFIKVIIIETQLRDITDNFKILELYLQICPYFRRYETDVFLFLCCYGTSKNNN